MAEEQNNAQKEVTMDAAGLSSIVLKHLSGQHNQKKHGYRGTQKVSQASMAMGMEYSPDQSLVRSIEDDLLANFPRENRQMIKEQVTAELVQIARDHPVGVRVPYDSAIQILESGRVKTQFETKTSQGYYNLADRADAEKKGLGIPEDLDPTKRPVYGYFMGAADNDGASGYGEIIFELKHSIKDRTTITQGDSLNGFADGKQIGTPARNPGIGSVKFDDYNQNNPLIKQGYKDNQFSLDRNVAYFEAQIYGGVSMKDVMMIRFGADCFDGKTMQLSDKYADLAEKFYQAGFDVEISRPFNQDIFSVKEFRSKELDPALENLEETLGVNLVGFWDAYQKSDKKDETWTEGFLKALAAGIIAAYLLGRGGADEELSQEEIDRLQEYIEEQSQYLDGFGSAAGGLTPAMGAARAGMYAAALTLPFWWGRTRYLELPAYPGDGSTTCLSRCKCHWEIVPLDEDAGDYDCTWVLGLAEHCSDCVDRSMAWRPLQVRGWNYSTSQKEVLEAVALKHLSGEHNQKKHGYRGAAKVSQQAKRDIEKEPPTMPAQLSRGTTGQVQERMRERVAIMEKTYPGVKFSTATANIEAVKRNSHLPGIGVPRAILDQKATPIDDPELHARLRLAYEQVTRESAGGRMPAATYTMIKFASGLTFQQVFGIINSMRKTNPKSVSLSVDRSGASVVFGLRDANGMPI